MDEFNGMKAIDIIKLIKACRSNGVREFSCGDLEFYIGAVDNKEQISQDVVVSSAADPVLQGDLFKEQQVISPEAEADIHEQQWDETLIADPLAHEELMLKSLEGEDVG